MARRSAYGVTALLCLALLSAGCQGGPKPTATPAPTAAQVSETSAPAGTSVTSLPQGATTLKEIEADLDGDGTAEKVAVYQASGNLGLLITPQDGKGKPWSASLGAGSLKDLSTRDLNADRLSEILVETAGPEANTFGLWVVRWAAGQGQFLAPAGEAASKPTGFRSQIFAPLIDDLEGDGVDEIVVAVDKGDAHFLDTVVYGWNGKDYAKSELYLMPPRVKPAPTTSTG